MNSEEFSQQIKAARCRASWLYLEARKSLLQQQELLVQAFESIDDALTKLQLAERDLRKQKEKLADDRKAVEEERQRYQKLLEFTPAPYLVTDRRGIIRESNHAASTLLNVPQRFLAGKPLAGFVSKEQLRDFLKKLNRLLIMNQKQEWEVRLQPRNGDPIDAILTVSVICNQEDKAIALDWLISVTARKQEESELGLLRSALQYVNDAIAVTSTELDEPGPSFVFVNPAFTKMTGYTLEDLTGKTPRILQGSKTDCSLLNQLRQKLSQKQKFEGEVVNYSKNGTEYKVKMCCFPIINEREEITHFISLQNAIALE